MTTPGQASATTVAVTVLLTLLLATDVPAETLRLESPALRIEIDAKTGRWSLCDKAADVRWPSEGSASPGEAKGLAGDFRLEAASANRVRLVQPGGAAVVFELVDEGRSVLLRYEGAGLGDLRVLDDALAVTDAEQGAIVVPCREGLLIPADSGTAFQQTFGTSEYEGCHMNMLGFLKRGASLVVTWDDAYVWPEVQSTVRNGQTPRQRITAALVLRRTARSVRLAPLGKGDWNTLAAGYRRIADAKGLAVTLRQKIARNPHVERMVGASNVKLWMCLARKMNDASNKQESATIHWTFDEAAAIAEHLHKDIGIGRCLFILGGWTEGGYDCRHPDNLPANPECGGNDGLATAVRRIQALQYVASLHDNYQDMYRDAKSWDPACIEKRSDGSLIQGGQWMGGRAYMVCAPKQLAMAMRPQNLPEIHRLFGPSSYFIDTTYAVGPRECADPKHPIGRNDDIAWKIRLSDEARKLFGLFGSECGREWALPHSDYFEGLVGVAGRPFHNLKPESLGAKVIPFWEMVYHDCQICYGKYEYDADKAAEYVAHHVLCARPLHYHDMPDHRYWQGSASGSQSSGPQACFTRTDQGWGERAHPMDAFLKTTHEVLGPLHEATAYERLRTLEFLTADRSLRRAVYGEGENATTVVVNFAEHDARVQSRFGGETLLPPWGFVIDSPRLAAFYAKRYNGRDYPAAALFTLQAVGNNRLSEASSVRVFHGFGAPKIVWKGATHEVRREAMISSERSVR
jgi:hypothetical protein